MPPDPWTHPTLRDFGFQNMDIPNGAGDPPSPSTDHSEALSDLYGDEPEVPWVDAIAELMPEAVVDHPETIWYTGLLGYCTCSKSISEERWGEFQAKFQEIVLKRWTYEVSVFSHLFCVLLREQSPRDVYMMKEMSPFETSMHTRTNL